MPTVKLHVVKYYTCSRRNDTSTTVIWCGAGAILVPVAMMVLPTPFDVQQAHISGYAEHLQLLLHKGERPKCSVLADRRKPLSHVQIIIISGYCLSDPCTAKTCYYIAVTLKHTHGWAAMVNLSQKRLWWNHWSRSTWR